MTDDQTDDQICIACGQPITPEFAYDPPKDFCRRSACIKVRAGAVLSVEEELSKKDRSGVVTLSCDLEAPFARARFGLSTNSSAPSTYVVKPEPKQPAPAPARTGLRVRIDLGDMIKNAWSKNWFEKEKGEEVDEEKEPYHYTAIPAYRYGEPEPEVISNEEFLEWARYCAGFDARRELGLSLQTLATWINDPVFQKLIIEEVVVERYKVRIDKLRSQYRLNGLKPPSDDILRKIDPHVPVPVVKRKKKRALKDAERHMYLDLAEGKLSNAQMLEQHGAWSDAQIRELEVKIIRHAIEVRLYKLPPPSCFEPEIGDPLSALFDRAGRNREVKDAGLGIHNNQRSFARGDVHEGGKLTAQEKYDQKMGAPEGHDGDDF